MSSWQKETCSTSPETFQRLNDALYIQRRNVKERTTDQGTQYDCESRTITTEEYDAIMEVAQNPAITDLINKQETMSSNQDSMMMAIADLYDAVAALKTTTSK